MRLITGGKTIEERAEWVANVAACYGVDGLTAVIRARAMTAMLDTQAEDLGLDAYPSWLLSLLRRLRRQRPSEAGPPSRGGSL